MSDKGYSLSYELHDKQMIVKLIGQGQLYRTAEPCKVTSPGALFPRLTDITEGLNLDRFHQKLRRFNCWSGFLVRAGLDGKNRNDSQSTSGQ